jgi:hypothetical protein
MASSSARSSVSDYAHDSFAAGHHQIEESFSIDMLLSRVEEVQRSEKLATLQTLTRRNALLQQVMLEYQQQWCCALKLLEETHHARLSVQKAMERCADESAAAEKAWLAYWGIGKVHSKSPAGGCSFATWI